MCWGATENQFVDAATGNVLYGGGDIHLGPLLSNSESAALQRFAWAEGWWKLWHEVRQYNGKRVPTEVVAQLDRPDAPTPTPFPPTATPPANATATATPTPVPMATRTATPPPAPMQVNRVNFGSPVAGTVFEELLARMPDNEITRELTQLFDVAGPNARFGLEMPPPGSGEGAFIDYVQQVSALNQQGLPTVFPSWPAGMNEYATNVLSWHTYVAFDFLSVSQHASASRQPVGYDIAFGQFDPKQTADALAVCECEQPDIRVHNGTAFYSWGPDGAPDLRQRLAPPMYDNLGRGPRLLVQDGEAYYTVADAAIQQIIDASNGDIPSLADDAGYIGAVRWMAALGSMSTMSFKSIGLSLPEIEGLEALPPAYLDAVNSAPLLRKFDSVAIGTGYDGQRKFSAVVIANPDAAAAAENAGLLEQRLREGHHAAGVRWADATELTEIDVQGRFVVARLYFNMAVNLEFQLLTLPTLTISE
jgi:hypothetical protein